MVLAGLWAVLAALSSDVPAVSVALVPTEPAVVRQTRQAPQRLIYIEVSNPGPEALQGLRLRYRARNRELERPLLDVPPGGAWDTVWLPEPPPPSVPVELRRGQQVLWRGTFEMPPAPLSAVAIPLSPPVRHSQISPLTLRGTNYFPGDLPDPHGQELDLMVSLNMNSFRTFLPFDPESDGVRPDGAATAEYVARVHALLTAAEGRKLKVILCPSGLPSAGDAADAGRRFLRTIIEPFAYDGRVLMWDLSAATQETSAEASPEFARLWAELERAAPDHLRTTTTPWDAAPLWGLGVKPPVAQFHVFSETVGVQPEGAPPVRNLADDLRMVRDLIGPRPVILGAFGAAAASDRDEDLARQAEYYRHVLEGAEAAEVAGVYNWTLFDLAPEGDAADGRFGIVRPDGSLRPAGEVVRDTFARWRLDATAPWEPRRAPVRRAPQRPPSPEQ